MSDETTKLAPTSEQSQQGSKEFDWNEVVEKQLLSPAPLLVEVSDVDAKDGDVGEVKVGDNLLLRDVTVEHVQLALAETCDKKNGLQNDEGVVIPVTFGGKYKPCPFHPPSHTFGSMREVINVYPFINDIIFPQEPITIEGTEIPAWEILKVITLVQDMRSNQLLEVNIVKRQRHVLLPATLDAKFLQWNEHWKLQDEAPFRRDKPRVYSLLELCEFWSPSLHPMTIEIYKNEICSEEKSPVRSPSKEPISKKFVSKIFKTKERKASSETLSEKSPVINNQTINEDYWMIPEAWRLQKLTFKPIHVVRCTNANTSAKLTLIGEQKIKVLELIKTERSSSIQSSDAALDDDDSPRSSRSLSETSFPLHQLDLMSLLGNKSRSNAIVGVVTSGVDIASRQSNSMAFGSWVALHRTRRVRKLLIVSTDAQHFLVSAHYAGRFVRLPLLFDVAGDIPTGSEVVYITRCTAYPVEKELDSCRQGQYVRFKNVATLTINNTEVNVVHCMVSSEKDGQQHAATYPLNLRGRFEKVDESLTEMTTHELFKQSLPICAKIQQPDTSLGFDPLELKQSFVVKKIVSETTVIVETLRKYEDCVKPGGRICEIPSTRGSLFIREVPTMSEDAVGGVLPYPRKTNFKGLEKLPCVEVLAECDIVDLQDDSRRGSSSTLLSPTGECKDSEEASLILKKQVQRPSYAVVNKIARGKIVIMKDGKGKEKSDTENGTLSCALKTRRTASETDENYDSPNQVLSSFNNNFKPKPLPRKRLMTMPACTPTGQSNSLPSFNGTEKTTVKANGEASVTPEQTDPTAVTDQHSRHSEGCIAFSSGEYAVFQEATRKWSAPNTLEIIAAKSSERDTLHEHHFGQKSFDSSNLDEEDGYEDVEEEGFRDYEDVEEENVREYEDIEEENVREYEDVVAIEESEQPPSIPPKPGHMLLQ